MAIPISIVCGIQYQLQYQYQLFLECNINGNTNTNCLWNTIPMAILIQFFFLCSFNINCNSNTFNCQRTNSNVQAINSYLNLPISIAIAIVPELHKQLPMAMAIPSKTAIPMAPQYYCSCLLLCIIFTVFDTFHYESCPTHFDKEIRKSRKRPSFL